MLVRAATSDKAEHSRFPRIRKPRLVDSRFSPPGCRRVERARSRPPRAARSAWRRSSAATARHECFPAQADAARTSAKATFRVLAQGRLRRRCGARFRGGLPAAAELADADPATALRAEGPCCARVRRCRDCPRAVARRRRGDCCSRACKIRALGLHRARPWSTRGRRARYPRHAGLASARCRCQSPCESNPSPLCAQAL